MVVLVLPKSPGWCAELRASVACACLVDCLPMPECLSCHHKLLLHTDEHAIAVADLRLEDGPLLQMSPGRWCWSCQPAPGVRTAP
jgi:hypothetical protein